MKPLTKLKFRREGSLWPIAITFLLVDQAIGLRLVDDYLSLIEEIHFGELLHKEQGG